MGYFVDQTVKNCGIYLYRNRLRWKIRIKDFVVYDVFVEHFKIQVRKSCNVLYIMYRELHRDLKYAAAYELFERKDFSFYTHSVFKGSGGQIAAATSKRVAGFSKRPVPLYRCRKNYVLTSRGKRNIVDTCLRSAKREIFLLNDTQLLNMYVKTFVRGISKAI